MKASNNETPDYCPQLLMMPTILVVIPLPLKDIGVCLTLASTHRLRESAILLLEMALMRSKERKLPPS